MPTGSMFATAGIAAEPDGPLFRTAALKTARLPATSCVAAGAYRMIQRCATTAGIKTPGMLPYFPRDRYQCVSAIAAHPRCPISDVEAPRAVALETKPIWRDTIELRGLMPQADLKNLQGILRLSATC